MVLAIAAGVVACTKSRPPKPPVVVVTPKLKLAVLAVESDRFPAVAEAATASLAKAHVIGIDNIEVSKVSLEVVQLSIECVEQTPDCYEAVGKSLAANRLLFAQVSPGTPPPEKPIKLKRGAKPPKDVRVTVTLFDVDSRAASKTAEKLFPNETDATAGMDGLIAEATSR